MSFHQMGTSDCAGCASKLKEADPRFTYWFSALKLTFPDLHISVAHRNEADQDAAFASGKSKLKWPDSPHNKTPSLAVDLFEINAQSPQGKWDKAQFTKIDQWNTANGYKIRWGGNFKSLGDFDHFEMSPGP